MSEKRPDWDKTRLAMAREIAKRSLCDRDQVGAVIVDSRNRIIGEGYNGPPATYQHNNETCTQWCPRSQYKTSEGYDVGNGVRIRRPDYADCPSLHAEANALLMSDRTHRLQGTIYVTSFPCTGCLKLISNSGLRRIYVGVDGLHEYRYHEEDYETVRRLGFQIAFEDGRYFADWITVAPGWVSSSCPPYE